MKNHPLFNGNETDKPRQAIDIRFINIVQFQGGKRVMLTDQWLPEDLLTPEQLFAAVGAGTFELMGRDEKGRTVDRETITIQPPKASAEATAPAPATPPMPAGPLPIPPSMQGGGLQIPANADPSTAMMFMMINAMNAQNVALREESRFAAQNQTQLMGAFLQSQSQMVTGLATAFSGRHEGSGVDQVGTAFIKGIEAMGGLVQGFKEGQGRDGNGDGMPMNWADVSKNILESLKQVADIARATGGTTPPQPPIVPPGGPEP